MNPMDPAATAGGLAASLRGSGVRRVNNLPLYIMVALVAVFLLIMALVAVNRAAQRARASAAPSEKAGNSNAFAHAIAGAQTSGIIQAEPSRMAAAAMPQVIDIARPDNPDAPPRPGRAFALAQPDNDDAQRVHRLKLQQLEEAIKAQTGVRMAAPRSAASAPRGGGQQPSRVAALARLAAARQQIDAQARGDPSAAFLARLQQLQAQAPERGAGSAAADAAAADAAAAGAAAADPLAQFFADPASGKAYAPFQPTGAADRWQLASRPEAPRSPYTLRAGFVLPAVLISGINSDLPGQIVAQVSQDVFDTASGKWRLIPQGARLVGQYASDVAYGQSRVLVAWQRIVFPDGQAMDIGAMPGADGAGYAGFEDRSKHHAVRLFGAGLLMSGVTAGIALSQRETASPYGSLPTTGSALSEALGQQLGQVTAQLIAKNMGIAPTLQIRPGYRFNVVVTKDLNFSRPYPAWND